MTVAVTEAAAGQVQRQLDARGRGAGIRIVVKTSGCSWLAYVLESVDAPDPEDTLFEDHGVKLFIDPKSLVYYTKTTYAL